MKATHTCSTHFIARVVPVSSKAKIHDCSEVFFKAVYSLAIMSPIQNLLNRDSKNVVKVLLIHESSTYCISAHLNKLLRA